jgi:hypothetical protein
MRFQPNAFSFVLIVAAAFNAVPFSAAEFTAAVGLGYANDYVILAKSGISTVPHSVITGDIGVSPVAATAITGFGLTLDSAGQFSTASQLTGKAYAASYGGATATALTVAVSAMETAYTDAGGRTNSDAARMNLGGGILGGVFGGENAKLTPGVYTFNTGVTIASTIYFDGCENSVFIIQMTGNLKQAKNTKVILSNGALAKNIFWQVSGHVAVATGAHLEGILLVKTDVLFETGSSLNGRVLAQAACNLQMATVTDLPVVPGPAEPSSECDCTSKTVGMQLVGSLGFGSNWASPVLIGDNLFFIDQIGKQIYNWQDNEEEGTLTSVFGESQKPDYISWDYDDFNAEYIVNIAPGSTALSSYVILGSTVLPPGMSAAGTLPILAGFVGPTSTEVANLYDSSVEVHAGASYIPESQIYNHIICNLDKDKNVQPIIAFEVQGGGTHKGKSIIRRDDEYCCTFIAD